MKYKKLVHISTNIFQTWQSVSEKLTKSAVSAFSGQAAFFLILSFFPFAMFLFSMLRFTPFSPDMFFTLMSEFIPVSFRDFLNSVLMGIYESLPGSFMPVTIISALWLSSKSFNSLIQGLNFVYEVKEKRNWLILRIFSMLYTIIFAVLIIAILTIIVFGNKIYFALCTYFPVLNGTLLSIISIRPIISFCILFLFFCFMYKIIPARKASLTEQIPGSLIATAGWLIFSYLYSYYVDHYSNYSSFYGTITTVALLMVWLYACMYIFFLGGLINTMLWPDLDNFSSK